MEVRTDEKSLSEFRAFAVKRGRIRGLSRKMRTTKFLCHRTRRCLLTAWSELVPKRNPHAQSSVGIYALTYAKCGVAESWTA